MRTTVQQGTIFLTTSSLLFVAAGYLVTVALGRLLGPGDYGLLSVIVAVMTVGNTVHARGVPQALSRYTAERPERADAVLRSALILQLTFAAATALGFALLAQPLAVVFREPGVALGIVVAGLTLVPYAAMTLYQGHFNGLHHFRRQALVVGVYSLAKIFAILGLGFAFGVGGALVGYLVAASVALLVGIRLPRATADRFPYAALVRFSVPLVGFVALSTLLLNLDLIAVRSLLADEAQAGYYAAAQQISRVPFFALGGLTLVLLPAVAQTTARGDRQRAALLVRQSLRYALMILAPGALFASTTAVPLISLIYGETYAGGAPALALVAPGVAALAVLGLMGNVLIGAGRPGLSVATAAAGTAVAALLALLLVPSVGITGAAAATTAGASLAAVAATLLVWHLVGGALSALSLARIVAVAAAVAAVAGVLQPRGLLLPIAYGALFLTYLLLLTLLGELRREDWSKVLLAVPWSRKRTPRIEGSGDVEAQAAARRP